MNHEHAKIMNTIEITKKVKGKIGPGHFKLRSISFLGQSRIEFSERRRMNLQVLPHY
jgi:hypothetical protein